MIRCYLVRRKNLILFDMMSQKIRTDWRMCPKVGKYISKRRKLHFRVLNIFATKSNLFRRHYSSINYL